MAEEKKDKKPGGGGGKPADKKPAPKGLDGVELIIGVVLILAVVGTVLQKIYALLGSGDVTFYGVSVSGAGSAFQSALPVVKIISFSLSAVFAFGAIVFSQLRGTILIAEKKKIYPDGVPKVGEEPVEEQNPMADKWKQVVEHLESEHPSDWRLAIIEADIMLGDLLDKLNLGGETIGDKLKQIEKSDFVTLDMAWEAHKIRNQIAHEGSEFLFNQREARRAIDLYRQVFEEFYMI